MQYATKAARIGAYLIDNIILNVLVFICTYISAGLGVIVAVVGGTLYFGLMEGSGLHGILGKYLMGIVTVDENGTGLCKSVNQRERHVYGDSLGIKVFDR